jgi:nitroimidazol reductase NimA-like FMN-containing flavoprotein (pyridoxamine 5'-phosphate oxidase superfamily)
VPHNRSLRDLTVQDCWSLLRATPVGRVVFTDHALPAALPVNYVVSGTSIIFRTSAESRLAHATDDQVVGFEVDHVDAVTWSGWSVLAVGVAQPMVAGSEMLRATKLGLATWAGDGRDLFVKITPAQVTGRVLNGPPQAIGQPTRKTSSQN